MSTFVKFLCGLATLTISSVLYAADTGATNSKISFIPSANAAMTPAVRPELRLPVPTGETLVFSAPPRESAGEAAQIYEPVAQYFSRVLGRKVEYRHPKSWLSYQSDAAKGHYDIVFNEPHFNSWNVARLNHATLAKISDESVFVVVTRSDDYRLTTMKQLAGKKVCSIGSSNLGTLALLAEFDAMRQPLVIENANWAKVYEGLTEGRCTAATLPVAILKKFDRSSATRVIHRSAAMPNQVFSASPRLTQDEQAKLTQALISADGKRVLTALLAANGAEKGLALASKEEYAGMDSYLKDVWGYGR